MVGTGSTLTVPVVFRDFTSLHPNFECGWDSTDEITPGLVDVALGADGRPQFSGTSGVECQTDARDFAEWYTDTANAMTVPGALTLFESGSDYVFETGTFFPLDGQGWVGVGMETTQEAHVPPPYGNWESAGSHNFYFTTELRFWFEYASGQTISFLGDDDLWIFVNGRLVVDVGGIHSPMSGSTTLDGTTVDTGGTPLNLVPGTLYQLSLFHAERHTTNSSFALTLGNFTLPRSECVSVCGDGVLAVGEQCDDGVALNDGSYGRCSPTCTLGPRCGDGTSQSPPEQCDSATNTVTYDGCAPGCVIGPLCGDGEVQRPFEQCDDGVNDGGYGECGAGCVPGLYCGDGITTFPEQCDDGNNADADGCSPWCTTEQ